MSQYTMSANQLGAVEQPPLADLERRVLEWLRTEAGFAQVYSINKDGYPVGRTMAAPIDDDFTVWLVQRKVHKRINQWRRNTRTEVVWVGTPAPGSRNDSPHVYDLNLLVPRVVFLRGDVEFLDLGAAFTFREFNWPEFSLQLALPPRGGTDSDRTRPGNAICG